MNKSSFHTSGFIAPPQIILLMLTILMIFCSLLGTAAVLGYSSIVGFDLQNVLLNLSENSPLSERNYVRTVNMISHFMTFSVPALILMLFLYRKNWYKELQLHKVPNGQNVALGILLLLLAFPLAQWTFTLNQQLPLPDWVVSTEAATNDMISGLLVMNSPLELAFNLLIIAVLPALGEEILFRGIIQPNLSKYLKNPIVGLWLTAIIFSAIHMQFQGFLPRMVLGALLGYLFYWTNNLWIPIIAHLVNNGIQVLIAFQARELIQTTMENGPEQQIHWTIGLASLFLVLMIGSYMKSKLKRDVA